MPPRSSWKGFIRLSLVSVPVKAYTASSSGSEIRLNQLHKECHNRIKYQKTCPEHGEVSNDEIVSGYEYSKGQYVVIDPAEVAKLRTQSDKAINIDGFIPAAGIDPLYHSGKTLYLVPDGPVGQKPYALLRETMEEEGLVAFSKMILSGRTQLVIVRPLDGLLAATVLVYAAKLKDPSSFEDEIGDPDFSKEELELTRTLVEASTLSEFDLASYKDDYTEQLTKIIESKVEGQEIVAVPNPEEPKVINLMEALKESVANARGAARKTKRKSAASVRKKTTRKTAASKKKMAPSARSSASTAKRKRKSG